MTKYAPSHDSHYWVVEHVAVYDVLMRINKELGELAMKLPEHKDRLCQMADALHREAGRQLMHWPMTTLGMEDRC